MNTDVIVAVIGTGIAALGLPELWKLLTSNKGKEAEAIVAHNAEVQEISNASAEALKQVESDYKEKIRIMEVQYREAAQKTHKDYTDKMRKMELEMVQFRMGVDMLITIIETEFDDNPNYLNVITKVKQLIHPIEDEGELKN